MFMNDLTWLSQKIEPYLDLVNPIRNDGLVVSSGNAWSLKKELLISEYIKPFIEIMNNNNYKTHYYDPFCGAGLFDVDYNGGIIKFPGSPVIAYSKTDSQFDNYHFSDLNRTHLNTLERRLGILFPNNTLNLQRESFVDSTSFIDNLSTGDGVLAIIDPAGYAPIPWKSVYKILKHPPLDAFLTITTSGITRNIDNQTQDDIKLKEFLGINDFNEVNDLDINGDTKIDEIMDAYKKRIHRKTGKFVNTLTINTIGSHKYELLLISRKPTVMKIFSHILEKLENLSNDQILGILATKSSHVKTMDYYFQK